MNYGLYLHIPFCLSKCFYCDFPSFAKKNHLMDSYIEYLLREIKFISESLPDKKIMPRTIYIGGGTPTALSLAQWQRLGDAFQENISLENCLEFTVEMNPGTADRKKLEYLRELGVNRLSIGLQSLNDACLEKIGRIHNAKGGIKAIALARELGFSNINIDLMYGLPGQNLEILKESLQKAVELAVEHISIYGLQLEEGTQLAQLVEEKREILPKEEEVEKMYDYIMHFLPLKGYERYEISNFSLPGKRSLHNYAYWQDIDYLGLGCGSHSYWQGIRYEQERDLDLYMQSVEANAFLGKLEEYVQEKEHMEEFCFLALRTIEGINIKFFQEKFKRDFFTVYGAVVEDLFKEGLLGKTEDNVYLTEQGMKFGNQVFEKFLL